VIHPTDTDAQLGRILVVDDEPADLDLLRHALEQDGYKILVATSGERALQIVGRTRPDLILLDVTMPGLDGFDTCERLKTSADTREIPVVFLTASSDSASLVRGFAVGGDDFIAKPFQRDEVLARVAARLAVARHVGQLLAVVAGMDPGGPAGTPDIDPDHEPTPPCA
jgi:DNA-binding response OmpR family regulator